MRDHPSRPCRFPVGPLLTTIDQLEDPGCSPEEVLHLSNARVVLADYPILQHDFPQLGDEALFGAHPELARLEESKRRPALGRIIDGWLLRHFALVSQAQAAQSVVNTPIPVSRQRRPAHRPTRYGRSLVAPLGSKALASIPDGADLGPMGARLVDVKGAGVAPGRIPSVQLHCSGLMQLGEALQDTVVQWAIEAVFRHSGSGFAALPLYAVLDPGFDVFTADGRAVPAGMQLRRAHRRPVAGEELPHPGSPEELLKAEAEMLLRHYGITSCNVGTEIELSQKEADLTLRYGGRDLELSREGQDWIRRILGRTADWEGSDHFEGINIQFARDVGAEAPRAQLVDFGHYSFRDRFHTAVVNLVRGWPFRWGGTIDASHPLFAQPIEELRVPGELWKGSTSWDLAEDLRRGDCQRGELTRRVQSFLGETAKRWKRDCFP